MRFAAWAGFLLCLAGALWYARSVEPGSARLCASGGSSLTGPEVEKSFEEASGLIRSGKTVEALLALQKRAAAGDALSGPALFLMGEAAFAEGAWAKGVERYIEALRADPSMADRNAPWGAPRVMAGRVSRLREGPWSALPGSAEELARLNYLDRRLAGGCQ